MNIYDCVSCHDKCKMTTLAGFSFKRLAYWYCWCGATKDALPRATYLWSRFAAFTFSALCWVAAETQDPEMTEEIGLHSFQRGGGKWCWSAHQVKKLKQRTNTRETKAKTFMKGNNEWHKQWASHCMKIYKNLIDQTLLEALNNIIPFRAV